MMIRKTGVLPERERSSKNLSDRPTSSTFNNQQSSQTRPRGHRNNRFSSIKKKSNNAFKNPEKGSRLTIGIKNPTTERRNPFTQNQQQNRSPVVKNNLQNRPKHSRFKVQRKRPGSRRGQKAKKDNSTRFKSKAFTSFGNGQSRFGNF